MFVYRKRLEETKLTPDGQAYVDSSATEAEVKGLVRQMELAQPTHNPLNDDVRRDVAKVAGCFAVYSLYTGENTWYARAERFVGEALLAAAGLQIPSEVVYLDSWEPSETTALWLSWLYHNGSREERAAAAGLMPVIATLMVEGCVQDYWSCTGQIAIYALHERVGRTKMVA